MGEPFSYQGIVSIWRWISAQFSLHLGDLFGCHRKLSPHYSFFFQGEVVDLRKSVAIGHVGAASRRPNGHGPMLIASATLIEVIFEGEGQESISNVLILLNMLDCIEVALLAANVYYYVFCGSL